MRLFSIRVVSSLMGATERQWNSVLQERQSEVPFGAITYGPIYRVLLALLERRRNASAMVTGLSDSADVSPKVSAFRRRAVPHVQWFWDTVVPQVSAVLENLEGERNLSNPRFLVDGEPISGGPHCLVQWADGSRRLLYVVGPDWPKRRVQSLLALLQIYAREVYGMVPTTVVVADLHRHVLIQLHPLDPLDEATAIETVRVLRDSRNRLAS